MPRSSAYSPYLRCLWTNVSPGVFPTVVVSPSTEYRAHQHIQRSRSERATGCATHLTWSHRSVARGSVGANDGDKMIAVVQQLPVDILESQRDRRRDSLVTVRGLEVFDRDHSHLQADSVRRFRSVGRRLHNACVQDEDAEAPGQTCRRRCHRAIDECVSSCPVG